MNKNKVIAVDIGGTNIKMALMCEEKIIKSTKIPAHSEGTLKGRLKDISKAIHNLVGEHLNQCIGIGIGMPCLVDSNKKKATEIYKKFVDAPNINFVEWCQKEFLLPVVVEQDSKAALLGEKNYGVAKGYDNILMIIMGTGVGTAVMLNGRLLSSKHHFAGSLGSHIIIELNGRKCTCNSSGCLEAYTGSWALPGLIKEHPQYAKSILSKKTRLSYHSLKSAYKKHDIVAEETMKKIAKAMRVGVISLIHAYDPEVIIFSGGPLKMGSIFTDPMLNNIGDELWGEKKDIRFLMAENPNESVLKGLYYLVLQDREKRK